MKKLFCILALTFFGFTSFSQDNTTSSSEQQIEVQKNADGYMGKSEKIKAAMKNGEIPASFPKATSETTREEYNLLIKEWLRNNEDLVKEEKYSKWEKQL